MTKEEAIKTIKGEAWLNCQDKLLEAIDFVEKVLFAKPCDDCISRQDAVNACWNGWGHDNETIKHIERNILKLPPVTQKSETVTEFADRCRECGAKYGKLLKQEPYDDCISRRLAIVTAELGQVQGYEWLFKQLCDMPSVIPVPKIGRWISVSERLPEENKTVIASTEYGVYPEAKHTKRYGWEWAYEAGCDYWEGIKEIVTAWMPLPEKYEPESEDKE